MRTPLIAGNWKMNTTVEEGVALAKAVASRTEDVTDVEVAVFPPFISLAAVAEAVKGTRVAVGAQNMYFEEKGAFTGEISPLMLKGLCTYVLVGHSERRQFFGEKDPQLHSKMVAAVAHGLCPVLCVGENLQQREQGWTESVIANQVRAGLGNVPFSPQIVVAYEPVWAIGTGQAASGRQAAEVANLIRQELTAMLGASHGEAVRILYGGSVSPTNIAEFVQQKNIDGALVGGASLKADDFAGIVRGTATAKGSVANA